MWALETVLSFSCSFMLLLTPAFPLHAMRTTTDHASCLSCHWPVQRPSRYTKLTIVPHQWRASAPSGLPPLDQQARKKNWTSPSTGSRAKTLLHQRAHQLGKFESCMRAPPPSWSSAPIGRYLSKAAPLTVSPWSVPDPTPEAGGEDGCWRGVCGESALLTCHVSLVMARRGRGSAHRRACTCEGSANA